MVHGVVLAGLASLMATATPSAPVDKKKLYLAVDLLPEAMVPEPEAFAGVTPPPRPRPATAPERAAETTPRPSAGPVVPNAPAQGSASDPGDSVYLGPPSILIDPAGPPGLRGLMANDPCTQRYGPKAKECAGRDLATRTGPMDSVMSRSEDQLAQHFGDYMPKCRLRSGCDEGEWISTNGTRGVGKPPPGSSADRGVMAGMAGGAAGLGGLNTSVGRLGFNKDHTDTGFGD